MVKDKNKQNKPDSIKKEENQQKDKTKCKWVALEEKINREKMNHLKKTLQNKK